KKLANQRCKMYPVLLFVTLNLIDTKEPLIMYEIPVKKFIYLSLFMPFSLFAFQKKTKDNYLVDISQYVEEKTQIVRYMREKPNGQFLEIGSSWGDGIVNILENLPDKSNLKLIVADNNIDYLKAIPNRFPKIRPYI